MYRHRPHVEIQNSLKIYEGLDEVTNKIDKEIRKSSSKNIAMEVYPNVEIDNFISSIRDKIPDAHIVDTHNLFMSSEEIFVHLQDDLTTDEVFGRFSHKYFEEFLDPIKLKDFYDEIYQNNKTIILIGICASKIIDYDLLLYLDINRAEIQNKFREGATNWKAYNETEFSEKLKRAYYFDWPASTVIKEELLSKTDFYIDMNVSDTPKMITGKSLLESLKEFTKQPFRLVPFFQPGVWGGQWMKEKFNVGKNEKNLAWCFDGVPEENSIIAKSKNREIEMPAQNLVLLYPKELLGIKVFGQYGSDFPIRFDYLDTVSGGNLSLQVHPTLDYAYRNFGAKYTQDESYYILDSKENAKVYIGVKDGTNKDELIEALEKAEETGEFDEEKYINVLPAKKHDHFLIPGGTIHSSGKDSVVLEISATPNRFTFKLWDWGRLDLDGKPRPISIHHGKHVINTDFNESFVSKELYNNTSTIKKEENFIEEKTGLHELEQIETRKLTFSKKIYQSTEKSVNMLNLVEGEHVQIVSKDNLFEPFDVYYGETFIVPEHVKEYYIVPTDENKEVKVIKAFIR